ncbi:hypothetical protein [Azotosporobacter soli]|uniref:hypothetical protein n=1 Tax=Azotosporobacter soli TaxID=3055040 RepID=UPI0031FEDA8B
MSLMLAADCHGISVTACNVTCAAQVEYLSHQIRECIRQGYQRIMLFLTGENNHAPGLYAMLRELKSQLNARLKIVATRESL